MTERAAPTAANSADTSRPGRGDPTLIAHDIHVHYRYGVSGTTRLRSLLRERASTKPEVHAVRGVSLVARRGDVIGLVGRNGAGKSSLLRAMTGLLPVSQGSIHATAQPVRLGVNAAMQRMLPAKDNIILGGLALGMTRDEAEDAVEDVISFAGIGKAAERPLHTYSSGQRARLQFAVATAASPEIIMVDEALAVGDKAFKRRSRRRLKELAGGAGTVFVVSHSQGALKNLCNRGVWLEDGRLMMDGELDEVVDAYEEFMDGEEL